MNLIKGQLAGDPTVTYTNPPDAGAFRRIRDATSVLASRRKGKQATTINDAKPSSDLDSLVKILILERLGQASASTTRATLGPEEQQPRPLNATSASATTMPPAIPSGTLRKRMLTGEFCDQFTLSGSIERKLRENDISGPHCLRFLTDDELESYGFTGGERADLCDAQERWTHGWD